MLSTFEVQDPTGQQYTASRYNVRNEGLRDWIGSTTEVGRPPEVREASGKYRLLTYGDVVLRDADGEFHAVGQELFDRLFKRVPA